VGTPGHGFEEVSGPVQVEEDGLCEGQVRVGGELADLVFAADQPVDILCMRAAAR
jgi:hypothetical protein